MVRPWLMNIASWTIYRGQSWLLESGGATTYRGHGLDTARGVLPVDPHDIEAHRGDEPCDGDGAETGIVAYEGRNLLLMRISDGLASTVRLEQGRTHVRLHALF